MPGTALGAGDAAMDRETKPFLSRGLHCDGKRQKKICGSEQINNTAPDMC